MSKKPYKSNQPKRKSDALVVVVRPTTFGPSSGGLLTGKGQPSTKRPAFGGNPFEDALPPEEPTPKAPPGSRPRKKVGGAAPGGPSTTHPGADNLSRIHAEIAGKGETDLTMKGADPADGHAFDFKEGESKAAPGGDDGVAADTEVVKAEPKKKKQSRPSCGLLTLISRRLALVTGYGATAAWGMLNPTSTRLAESLLSK